MSGGAMTTDIAVLDPSLQTVSDAPAGFTPRKRTIQIGTALMTGASIMYFGGLFGIYVSSRNTHITEQEGLAALAADQGESFTAAPWIPNSAQVELTAPTITTWTLTCSKTMQWTMAWWWTH